MGYTLQDLQERNRKRLTSKRNIYDRNRGISTDTTQVERPLFRKDRFDPSQKVTNQNYITPNEPAPMKRDADDGFLGRTANFVGGLTYAAADFLSLGAIGLAADFDLTVGGVRVGEGLRTAASLGQYDPWEEETWEGNIGYGIGTILGIAKPLNWAKWGIGATTNLGGKLVGASSKLAARTGSKSTARSLDKASKYLYGDGRLKTSLTNRYTNDLAASNLAKNITTMGDDGLSALAKTTRNKIDDIGWSTASKAVFREKDEAILGLASKLRNSKETANIVKNMSQDDLIKLSGELFTAGINSNARNWPKIIERLAANRFGEGISASLIASSVNAGIQGVAYTGLSGLTKSGIHGATKYASDYAEMQKSQGIEPNMFSVGYDKDWLSNENNQYRHGRYMMGVGEHGAFLSNTLYAGLEWSFLGFSHLFRGGRQGYGAEGKRWLKNMWGGAKKIDAMSPREAKATVKFYEDIFRKEGTSLKKIMPLNNKKIHNYKNTDEWIESLSHNQSKAILNQVRKKSPGAMSWYLTKELGLDLFKSSPRMVVGSWMMYAPELIRHTYNVGYKQGEWDKVRPLTGGMGESQSDIWINFINGMAMSKHGQQSIMTKKYKGKKIPWYKGGSLWQQGDASREALGYYSAKNKAIREAYGAFGYDAHIAQYMDAPPVEYIRTSLESNAEFSKISQIADTYIEKDPGVIKNIVDNHEVYPLEQAFLKAVKESQGKVTQVEKDKLDMAMKLLNKYDEMAIVPTDGGMRPVTKEEALNIVENLTNLTPDTQSFLGSPDAYVDNIYTKALIESKNKFNKDAQDFMEDISQILGINYSRDKSRNRVLVDDFTERLNDLVVADENSPMKNDLIDLKETVGTILSEGQGSIITLGPKHNKKLTPTMKQMADATIAWKNYLEKLNMGVFGINPDTGESPTFMSNLGGLRDMYTANKQIHDMESQINLIDALSYDMEAGKQYNTLDPVVKDKLQEALGWLNLDGSSVPKLQDSDKNPVVLEWYNRMKDLRKSVRGYDSEHKQTSKEIRFTDIEAAKERFDDVFGTVLQSDPADPKNGAIVGESVILDQNYFNTIKRQAQNSFMKSLEINDKDNPNSTFLALQGFLDGRIAPDLTNFSSSKNLVSGFAKLTKDGVILPHPKQLKETLKQHSSDQGFQDRVDNTMNFYETVYNTVRKSGGKINYDGNLDYIQNIIKNYGRDGVVNLIENVKNISRKGHIKDISESILLGENKKNDLDQLQTDISEKEGSLSDDNKNNTLDPQIDYKQAKTILANSKAIINDINTKRQTVVDIATKALEDGDMGALLALSEPGKEWTKFETELDLLMQTDITKTTNISSSYETKILDLQRKIANLEAMAVGQVNINNLSKFLENEVNKNKFNLPDIESEAKVNINPIDYQKKYGLLPDVIEMHVNAAKINPSKLNRQFVMLLNKAERSRTKIDQSFFSDNNPDVDHNKTELLTDTYQVFSNMYFKKQAKMASFTLVGDNYQLRLSDTYVPKNDKLGMDGLNNMLGLNENYYIFGKNVKWADNDGNIQNSSAYDSFKLQMDAKLENGEVPRIDNQQHIDFIANDLSEAQLVANEATNMVRINLGEGAQTVIKTELLNKAIVDAYSSGLSTKTKQGKMYEYMLDIFKKHGGDKNQNFKNVMALVKPNMTAQELKNMTQITYLMLNRPEVIVTGDYNAQAGAKILKQFKIEWNNKGVFNSPERRKFKLNFLNQAIKRNIKFAEQLKNIHIKFESQQGFRSLSIKDEGEGSPLQLAGITNLIVAANKKYLGPNGDGVGGRLNTDEFTNLMARTNQDVGDPSVLDAPTYLTLDAMLYQTSDLGIRSSFFEFNEKGKIIGVKGGAIKPKGVFVDVDKEGNIMVYANKTALFYSPTIEAKVMEPAGVDVLSFSTGNKVNKVTKGNKIVDGTKDFKDVGTIDEIILKREDRGEGLPDSIEDILSEFAIHEAANGNQNTQLLPLETFINHTLKKPGLGSIGVNSGLHLRGDTNISEWMQVESKKTAFEQALLAFKSNPYTAQSIIKSIFAFESSQKNNNKFNTVTSPMEMLVANEGLLLSPYLGDQGVEKLFSYFYKGGKVGTDQVGNSSYDVMGVNTSGKFSDYDLPLNIAGTPRNLGMENISYNQAKQEFKWRGNTTAEANETVSGTSFSFETKFKAPGMVRDGDYLADVVFFEWPGGGLRVRVDGYIIDPDGTARAPEDVINSMLHSEEGDLGRIKNGESKSKKGEFKHIYDMAKKKYDHLKENLIGTNEDVIAYLAEPNTEVSDVFMVGPSVRQPRAQINDVTITKFSKTPTDPRKGNVNETNVLNMRTTHDADNDFDTKTNYTSTPAEFMDQVYNRAGVELQRDSKNWANTITQELMVELNTNKWDNSGFNDWITKGENSNVFRGGVVKLHQIASKFLNALGQTGDKVIGTVKDKGGRTYNIEFKDGAEYLLAGSNITKHIKILIDSYKAPIKGSGYETIARLQKDLLLGKDVKDSATGASLYEGLFKLVDTSGKQGNQSSNHIPEHMVDIRNAIMDVIVRPISTYLRLNRGEYSDVNMGNKQLTVQDIAHGYQEVINDLNYGVKSFANKKNRSLYSTSDDVVDINFTAGIDKIKNEIQTGADPFDTAARELNTSYLNSMNKKNLTNTDKFSDLIHLGLNEMLIDNYKKHGYGGTEIPLRLQNTVSYAKQYSFNLFKKVQTEGLAAELHLLNNTIQEKTNKLNFLLNEKFEPNPIKIEGIQNQITALGEIKSNIEIAIGSQYAKDIQKRTFKTTDKNFTNRSFEPVVVWNSKNKIAGIIKPGEAAENVQFFDGRKSSSVRPDDILVQNGKRFEIANTELQEMGRAHHLAFSSIPYIEIKGSKIYSDVKVEDNAKYSRDIFDTLMDQTYNNRDVDQDASLFVAEQEAVLHGVLNNNYNNRIKSEIERKQFIYNLLTPGVDRNIVTMRKTEQGKTIYNDKYKIDQRLEKLVTRYLFKVANGDFVNAPNGGKNVIKVAEAQDLLRDIATRQSLAYIDINTPAIEVSMGLKTKGLNWYKDQVNRIGQLNKNAFETAEPAQDIAAQNFAIDKINEYLNGRTIMPAYDIPKVLNQLEAGVPLNSIIEWNNMKGRTFGAMGEVQSTKKSPGDIIDMNLSKLENCIGGK